MESVPIPATPAPHQAETSEIRPENKQALFHELRTNLIASLAVNMLWWMMVNWLGLNNFPFLHFGLIVGILFILPYFDHKQYSTTPSTHVLTVRAGTNFALFILGLVILGPFGGIMGRHGHVKGAEGIFQFFMSWISIISILGFLRGMIHCARILIKHFA